MQFHLIEQMMQSLLGLGENNFYHFAWFDAIQNAAITFRVGRNNLHHFAWFNATQMMQSLLELSE